MPTPSEIADAVSTAPSWDARVAIIRRVPEEFGTAQQAAVYSAIAGSFYASVIEPDFAYVHWRPEYELSDIEQAYDLAALGTRHFVSVDRATLADLLHRHPKTLRVFRLLLGFTTSELGETCSIVAEKFGITAVTRGAIASAEDGRALTQPRAATCAAVIDLCMTGQLFPPTAPGTSLRRKSDKPDTRNGWESVNLYARQGVPLAAFLHQRLYGGAFRQLLDATSSSRGDLLEVPVEQLYIAAGIPFLRTGSDNQEEIATRFNLTVRPAPDFVVFDPRTNSLRAMIECKVANDGGTARDKAARFRNLRTEAARLGGVPVIAVLGGIGWRRAGDALGPVISATDGRAFTVSNISEMLDMEPFPGLRGLATPADDQDA